mgnify:CR=1 FL=1
MPLRNDLWMSGSRAGRAHLDSKGLSSFKITTISLGCDFVFYLTAAHTVPMTQKSTQMCVFLFWCGRSNARVCVLPLRRRLLPFAQKRPLLSDRRSASRQPKVFFVHRLSRRYSSSSSTPSPVAALSTKIGAAPVSSSSCFACSICCCVAVSALETTPMTGTGKDAA